VGLGGDLGGRAPPATRATGVFDTITHTMARSSPNETVRGGVDLGGTKIETIIVDAENTVLSSVRKATPTDGGPKDIAEQIAAAVIEAAGAAGFEPAHLAGLGIGSPGVIDAAAGTVAGARNLPRWQGTFELGPTLSSRLGIPVFLGNDVGVATEAEFRLGAGKQYRSLLGVFWGTGIGGGLILDGRRWLGRGGAGEIGHMVVKLDGRHCPCGRRGCLEAYAGRGAMEARARKLADEGTKTDLFKLMKQHDRTRLTSSIWAHAIEHKDRLATELIDGAVAALAAGIASVVNLLDVEAVFIGGGLGVRFGEPFARRIAAEMLPHLFIDFRPPAVQVAGLGDLGGALGAALLAAPAPVSA
jgi:glucokinase